MLMKFAKHYVLWGFRLSLHWTFLSNQHGCSQTTMRSRVCSRSLMILSIRVTEAFGRYLKYCWQTLVRCYSMATKLGMDPEDVKYPVNDTKWKNLVGNDIIDLFSYHKDGNESPINKDKDRLSIMVPERVNVC